MPETFESSHLSELTGFWTMSFTLKVLKRQKARLV